MRILIVSQYFWPENFRINDLALGLQSKGYTVTVLTGMPNYPQGSFFEGYGVFKKRTEDYRGIKVLRVPLIPRGRGGFFNLIANYLSFAVTATVLGPLYCRDRFDLIFVYEPSPITVGLPALLLKQLKSVPIILWVQDLWPESLSATGAIKSKPLLSVIERIVRFIYAGCDQILVQSKAFIDPIKKLGVPGEKINYFPNSAEDLYRPIARSSENVLPIDLPKGFRVMFAGNIGVAQDFQTILDAAELLKEYDDIHWIIVGDGRMRLWVEEEIEKRQLTNTVHLAGKYPAEKMSLFFAGADAMLATLKKEPIFALTIPAKVQSYLACARPVIAALEGEGARIIDEARAGIICPPENPEALSHAVLAMYHIPLKERETMGERGRNYFELHFERSMLMEQLDRWMQSLGGRKKCAS